VPAQDYSAYVGRFENFCPEGPSLRVLVRNGRLCVLWSLGEEARPIPLEAVGVGTFRIDPQVFRSPELMQFDTFMDGRALRVTRSGVSLYRKDTV
jgi:hypothetical protein